MIGIGTQGTGTRRGVGDHGGATGAIRRGPTRDRIRDYVGQAKAANTLRAYRADLRDFEDFLSGGWRARGSPDGGRDTWAEVRKAEDALVLATAWDTAARWRRMADEPNGFLPARSARLREAADEVEATARSGDHRTVVATVTRCAADLSAPRAAE